MGGAAKAARSKAWIEQIKALRGKAPPSETDEEPQEDVELSRTEFYYWEIFVEMNTQRLLDGEGNPAPLSLSDLNAAAQLFQVRKVDYEVFVFVMLALDREYVTLSTEENNRRREQERRKQDAQRRRGR